MTLRWEVMLSPTSRQKNPLRDPRSYLVIEHCCFFATVGN